MGEDRGNRLRRGCFVFSNTPQPKPDIVKGEEFVNPSPYKSLSYLALYLIFMPFVGVKMDMRGSWRP